MQLERSLGNEGNSNSTTTSLFSLRLGSPHTMLPAESSHYTSHNYALRRSRTRDTVKLTACACACVCVCVRVCVCVCLSVCLSVPAVLNCSNYSCPETPLLAEKWVELLIMCSCAVRVGT